MKSKLTQVKIYLEFHTIMGYCPKSNLAGLSLGVPHSNQNMNYYGLSELSKAYSHYSSKSESDRWKQVYLASESGKIPLESYPNYLIRMYEGPSLRLTSLSLRPRKYSDRIHFYSNFLLEICTKNRLI